MAIMPAESNPQLANILGVPLSSEGFFMEDNLKLRPMDFTREGIYLAGLAHYPKFIEESIAQALATAARAMTILSKEQLEVGGTIAIVDQAKCVGCLTCVRVCPFHIPEIDGRHGRRGDPGRSLHRALRCAQVVGHAPASARPTPSNCGTTATTSWCWRGADPGAVDARPAAKRIASGEPGIENEQHNISDNGFEPELTAFTCIYCGSMARTRRVPCVELSGKRQVVSFSLHGQGRRRVYPQGL
jgi:NAD-dependent dihydropyrimidine dehydrogenase PreA subunit